MCLGDPYEHTHVDRLTDDNDIIYTLLLWSYNSPFPKSYADLISLYAIFGIKYVYLHVLGLLSLPWS